MLRFLALAILLMPIAARADELDDWCPRQTKASSIVICSDPELRALAVIRNRQFTTARSDLLDQDYNNLLANQERWINAYTAQCGVASTGPAPRLPISHDIVECYYQKGRERIADLTNYIRRFDPQYQPPPIPPHVKSEPVVTPAPLQPPQPDKNEITASNNAADFLKKQAEQKRKEDFFNNIKERGFRLLEPVDLDLDWRGLSDTSEKIALRGVYRYQDDVDAIAFVEPNKDQPVTRLYTENASRDARKAMLECRDSNFQLSLCRMVVGGTIRHCVRNKGQLNEKEFPCIVVSEAWVIPEGM
jgi:uncharacterized protein YecT (DUF1311 family)